MSNVTLIASVTNPARTTSDNSSINQRGTRDGLAFTADMLLAYALEGRVQTAVVGSATTPATFASSYTNTQPSLAVDVPSGTTIIPVHIGLYLETQAGALTEVIALSSTTTVGAGTSTAVTPKSTRTSTSFTTACSAYSLYSGAGSAPTVNDEFYHNGWNFADAAANTAHRIVWNWQESNPQIIVGAGSFVIYVDANGNTAPTGFLRASWIEIPSASIT